MKLGVICESTVNAFYRAVFPMRAMQRRGHTVLLPDGKSDLPMATLLDCDLVHCYRRMDRVGDLRKLLRHGVAISFDNDDNYAAAEFSNTARAFDGRRENLRLARMTVSAAKLAHVTTTTCEPLADFYREAGVEHVAVIANRLEPGAFAAPPARRSDRVVLGWVADREHALDLERVPIVPALRQLLDAHAELRVVSVGLRLPLRSERYEHVEPVPLLELLRTTGAFDIGLAPLADTPFNRSRSDVKLKEYATGGTPWLASPVGPYRDHGEHEGGLLVDDQAWVEQATVLIESARRRRRLTKRALRWARDQAIDRHAEVWERAFAGAIERASSAAQLSRA
jgi:hypothetical protein